MAYLFDATAGPTKLGCTHPLRWLPMGAEGSADGLRGESRVAVESGDC